MIHYEYNYYHISSSLQSYVYLKGNSLDLCSVTAHGHSCYFFSTNRLDLKEPSLRKKMSSERTQYSNGKFKSYLYVFWVNECTSTQRHESFYPLWGKSWARAVSSSDLPHWGDPQVLKRYHPLEPHSHFPARTTITYTPSKHLTLGQRESDIRQREYYTGCFQSPIPYFNISTIVSRLNEWAFGTKSIRIISWY